MSSRVLVAGVASEPRQRGELQQQGGGAGGARLAELPWEHSLRQSGAATQVLGIVFMVLGKPLMQLR